MSLAARIAARFTKTDLVSTVVARYKAARSNWDDKFVGKDARLSWSRANWLLEELPQKGKKKLRYSDLQNPNGIGGGLDWFIPGNILMLAKLSPSDDYDKIKSKIEDAYKEAIKKSEEDDKRGGKAYLQANDWVYKIKWYEHDQFYLNVVPEGIEKFTVEGKDFSMSVDWTEFKTYSPNSDFQQSDPHYSKYESKSPTAARKAYLLLKSDPNQLKSITWNDLPKWFDKNKIQYAYGGSSWH
jgi:hypothetical protein